MSYIDQTSLTGLAAVGWLAAQPTTLVIRAIDPVGPTVLVRHGDGQIDDTSNPAGWQFTKRPRRTSLTEYMGVDGYTMKVPIVLDGFVTDNTVEGTWEVLRGIMRNRVGPRNEPAVVSVTGRLMELSWLTWVIQSLETKTVYRRGDGARTFIEADMTLMQYAVTDLAGTPQMSPAQSVAQSVQQSGSPSSKTYVVKHGDTLTAIAKQLLGDANRWHDIQALNPSIRDPNFLTIGQTLRIP